jgi:hypothetical protein
MARSLNPTFKKLTANQLIALSDVLRAHCHRSPEGAVYEDGWNDERVANEAIPEYAGNKTATVGHYRVALGFGRLRAVAKKESMGDRLAELEKRVDWVEKYLNRPSLSLIDAPKEPDAWSGWLTSKIIPVVK